MFTLSRSNSSVVAEDAIVAKPELLLYDVEGEVSEGSE